MHEIRFVWPEAKAGALTTSWDDGTSADRRLVALCNQHGIKGTWNLNSGKFGLLAAQTGWKDYVAAAEVATLYAGHEVACHSVTHPNLERLPEAAVAAEILADRRALEALVGYPVKGMSLPFGSFDRRVLQVLRSCGIVYVRPVIHTPDFCVPGDFMQWSATCHHKANLAELWEQFRRANSPDKLFYLWGHSYEFDNDRNWDHIERFAALAGAASDIWFATNMQVYEYVAAWRALHCALDLTSFKNASGVTLWIRVNGNVHQLAPGAVLNVAR